LGSRRTTGRKIQAVRERSNYEGLRHQIERLVRENEELKKLVQLIRENHELRSAIKTQAGGLGISGFSSGLGEAAASPPQRPGNLRGEKPGKTLEGAEENRGTSQRGGGQEAEEAPEPRLRSSR